MDYETFNDYETYNEDLTKRKHLKCPLCNEEAVMICDYINEEMTCENGHTWYVKDNRTIVRSLHN